MKIVEQKNCLYSFAIFALIFIALTRLFTVGSTGSDDISYIHGAMSVLGPEHYTPDTHWGFRYTLILPLSLFLHFFSICEQNILMFTLLFHISLFGYLFYLTFKLAHLSGTPLKKSYLILLFATSPALIINSSILNPDVLETILIVLVILNFLLYICTCHKKYAYTGALLAGLCLITRETAVLHLAAIAVGFIFTAKKLKIKDYIILLLISSTFLVIEGIYYLIVAGDFFYHFSVTLQTHLGGSFDCNVYQKHGQSTGNLFSGTALEPLTVLFINQEFGLLFFAALLSIFFLVRKHMKPSVKFILIYIALSFVLISFSGVVRLLPRYYFPIYAVSIITLAMYFQIKKIWHKNLLLAAIIAANLACLSVENIYPILHHRAYLNLTDKYKTCIHNNDKLERRAKSLSTYEDYNGSHLEKDCFSNLYYVMGEIRFKDGKNREYVVVEEIKAPPLLIGRIIQILHINKFLPDGFYRKLAYRNSDAKLIKIEDKQ